MESDVPQSSDTKDVGNKESLSTSSNPNKTKKSENLSGGKSVTRVSIIILCAGTFAILSSWAGLIGNLGHWFWIIAAFLMMPASIIAAIGIRIELRNHHWTKRLYNTVFFGILGICGLICVPVIIKAIILEVKPPELEPTISPNFVQLSDGEYQTHTEVSVFNPRKIPIYNVMVKFLINESGVSPDCIEIDIDDPPMVATASNKGMQSRGIVTWMYNRSTNSFVYQQIDCIAPTGHRTLFVSGRTNIKSSATISITRFEKEPPKIRWKPGEMEIEAGKAPEPGTLKQYHFKVSATNSQSRQENPK